MDAAAGSDTKGPDGDTQEARGHQAGPRDWFTGQVWMDEIATPGPPSRVRMLSVHTANPARPSAGPEGVRVGLGPLGERARLPAGDVADVWLGLRLVQRAGHVEVEERVHVLRWHGALISALASSSGWPSNRRSRPSTSPRMRARSAGRSGSGPDTV